MSKPKTPEREREVMRMINAHERLGTINDFGLSTLEYYKQIATPKETRDYLRSLERDLKD